jgi:hypothetical protein
MPAYPKSEIKTTMALGRIIFLLLMGLPVSSTVCFSQSVTLSSTRLDGTPGSDDLSIGRGHGFFSCIDSDEFPSTTVGYAEIYVEHDGAWYPECTENQENINLYEYNEVLDLDNILCAGAAASEGQVESVFAHAHTIATAVCTSPIGTTAAVPNAFCNVSGTITIEDPDCCGGDCDCMTGAYAEWRNFSECITMWSINGAGLAQNELATLHKYMYIAGYGGPADPFGTGEVNIFAGDCTWNLCPQVVCHVGASCVVADRVQNLCGSWFVYGTLSNSTSNNPGAANSAYQVLCLPDGFNFFLPSTEAVANGSQYQIRTASSGWGQRARQCEWVEHENGTDIWSFVSTGYATAVADQAP